MSSPARNHAEWLKLVETSGPFLSMPVLLRIFPQGLDPRDPAKAARLREAYEDWLDRGERIAAVHQAWVRHVLTDLLEFPPAMLAAGQAIPPGMEAVIAQHQETLRPDLVLKPADAAVKPPLLISLYPPTQDLAKPVAGRHWNATPGTRMMELLHAAEVPLGLVTNGEQWMLVYAPRGETTGFATWEADLWMQEPVTLRAFHSLLHLRRFIGVAAGDTLASLYAEIRFVLGEKTPGTPQFRDAFRAKFAHGWVLAEVFLNGERWLVGRPLSDTGYHPFARKDGSLADEFPKSPSRAGFSDYEAALDTAVFGNMPLRTLAESGDNLDWLRLITWLARDQEAHFSGLLEWRHKDSDAKSPDMSHDDRANLIRLVLGLVEKAEQDSLAKFAAKSQAHEQKTRDRGKMEFAVERERLKLEGALGMKVAKPDDPVLRQEVERRVAELKSETNPEAASARHEQEISALLTVLSQREGEYGFTHALVEEWQEAVDLEEARVAGTPPPKPQQKTASSYRTFLKNVGPFPGYCSHLLNKAWAAECPLADERPKDDDEVTQAVDATQSEAKPAMTKLASLKKELERRAKLAAPKKLALNKAREELTNAQARQKKELEALNAPWEDSKRISGLLVAYQAACSELDEWDKELNDLKVEKDELSKRLDDLTEQHKKLVNHFGQLFNHLVRHMLGDVVSGSVRFAGKSIVPELEYHGPRDSAAFKVVRWLVFDLAALALGLTDAKAHHPRFLIHDSPREADLAAPNRVQKAVMAHWTALIAEVESMMDAQKN